MERKKGICAECLCHGTAEAALSKIKRAGFDGFFAMYRSHEEARRLKEVGEQCSLEFEFIHAPFEDINALWRPGLSYLDSYRQLEKSIEAAAECAVPAVIVHTTSGWFAPPVSDVGLARYDALVELAIQKGVKVAFENQRRLGTLACLMDRYERVSEVVFCYDSGHEHCFTETVPFLKLYGKRLACTHLHDNTGRLPHDYWANNDAHLLPFDGDIDFARVAREMEEVDYRGRYMLEAFRTGRYAEMEDEAFLSLAFSRLKRMEKL